MSNLSSAFSQLALAAIVVTAFSGCDLLPAPRSTKKKQQPATVSMAPEKTPDRSPQTLCDVERTRARLEVLKRVKAEEFRKIALKVSRAVSDQDIKDLNRLAAIPNDSHSWEVGRARGELVAEIYQDAILRAGFSAPQTLAIENTQLSALVGLDAISASNDKYAEFLIGSLKKDLGEEGDISKVSLAASPDQTKYFVRVYRLSRVETKPDGTPAPVYSTENLFEAAEYRVSRHCALQGSALNVEEFNTIPGLTKEEEEAANDHH